MFIWQSHKSHNVRSLNKINICTSASRWSCNGRTNLQDCRKERDLARSPQQCLCVHYKNLLRIRMYVQSQWPTAVSVSLQLVAITFFVMAILPAILKHCLIMRKIVIKQFKQWLLDGNSCRIHSFSLGFILCRYDVIQLKVGKTQGNARCSCDWLTVFVRHVQEQFDSSPSLTTCHFVRQFCGRLEAVLSFFSHQPCGSRAHIYNHISGKKCLISCGQIKTFIQILRVSGRHIVAKRFFDMHFTLLLRVWTIFGDRKAAVRDKCKNKTTTSSVWKLAKLYVSRAGVLRLPCSCFATSSFARTLQTISCRKICLRLCKFARRAWDCHSKKRDISLKWRVWRLQGWCWTCFIQSKNLAESCSRNLKSWKNSKKKNIMSRGFEC